ncbi:MAG: DUF4876 domain-containing protein [Prolixibacteraceae bacterium]
MKIITRVILLALVLFSCIKEPEYHSYQLEITIDFPDIISNGNKSGAKVVLFNQLKSYSSELLSDENGKVIFSNVEPGFYSVTVIHSLNVDGITYFFNGLETLVVFNSMNKIIEVNGSKNNDFVIKEIYYSGSVTPAGKSYSSDQYIEIYNNSSIVQYADGLSVLEHESYATDENFWKYIKDTIVVRMIWTIPGSGTDVPVQPGQSIVLARDGINHKSDPNGNPLSPVNLGNAEFEFFVLWETDQDIDSPTVPNLEEDLFVFRGSDIVFHTRGGSALAIAKLPGKNQEERMESINSWLITKETAGGSGSRYYAKIANSYVIDAVEVTWDEAHAIYKRFPVDLDAGYTYVPSGAKSGKCVRRKIKEIVDGRTVYQDTNNATEDFLKDVDPKPKNYVE